MEVKLFGGNIYSLHLSLQQILRNLGFSVDKLDVNHILQGNGNVACSEKKITSVSYLFTAPDIGYITGSTEKERAESLLKTLNMLIRQRLSAVS